MYVAQRDEVQFISHETGDREPGRPFEDVLIDLVWSARDRGKRTSICDIVGDEPPY